MDDIVSPTAGGDQGPHPGNAILLKNVRDLPYEQEEARGPRQVRAGDRPRPLADTTSTMPSPQHRSQCSWWAPRVLPSTVGRLMEKNHRPAVGVR